MKKLLLPLLFLLPVAAFAQTDQKDPFIGRSKEAIIREFGVPNDRQSDGRGEILIYLRERAIQAQGAETGSKSQINATPAVAIEAPGGVVTAGKKKVDAYKFFVDKKGLVYSWKIDND